MAGSPSSSEPDSALLVRAAAALLDATVAMIQNLPDGVYAKPAEGCDDATIGQHVRHLVCHYQALVAGYEADGPVTYDTRERGTEVETAPAAAVAAVVAVRERLGAMDDVELQFPVRIRVMPSPDAGEVEIDSTFLRELAFVTHHGVHHHALIKLVARAHGVEIGDGFGRAPSTVAHDRGA